MLQSNNNNIHLLHFSLKSNNLILLLKNILQLFQCLYMERCGSSCYDLFYPRGWCIVSEKEKTHKEYWDLVSRNLVMDSIGRILVQLLLMFQVGVNHRLSSMIIGYRTSNSGSSSIFHHLALLVVQV